MFDEKNIRISDIAKIVKNNCDKHGIAKHCPEKIANGIYQAGYGQIEEIVDKFVFNLKYELEKFVKTDYEDSVPYYGATCEQIDDIIDNIVEEMKKGTI